MFEDEKERLWRKYRKLEVLNDQVARYLAWSREQLRDSSHNDDDVWFAFVQIKDVVDKMRDTLANKVDVNTQDPNEGEE